MIQPIGSRVLITPFKSADKTESGLYMENNSNTSAASVRGTVIGVGDTSRFKLGDDILFRRYSVDILKIVTEKGEEEVMMVDDGDIIGQYK